MFLDKKKVFLAGSTGMAGISILKYIVNNYPTTEIRAVYNKTTPVFKHKQITYVSGDLKSLDDCRRMVKGCDCAIMAAAFTGGAGFVKLFPWEHMKDNLLMNMQMLEAFSRENVKRVVFVGSSVLYQEYNGNIKEDDLDLNKDPHEDFFGFGWGARFIEKLCKFINTRYGIEIVVARVANIFGPYSKFAHDVSNFIPALIRKAVDRMDPFEVWGSADVTRDVIYSDDFARAIIMMADNDQIKFDVFNVGSGVKTTVGNVVEWVLKYSNHTPSQIKYLENKPTTIKYRVMDCKKVKSFFGWEPQLKIEDGIRMTTEWWIQNRDSWIR
jgi:GDP-L-fucose synthase